MAEFLKRYSTCHLTFLIILGITFFGCSSIPVTYNLDESAPFTTFKTYKLIMPDQEKIEEMQLEHPERLNLVEGEIVKQMAKRKYYHSENPDMEVHYYLQVASYEDVEVGKLAVGSGIGYQGVEEYSMNSIRARNISYKTGALFIDIVDKKQNKLIWHGVAEKSFQGALKNPEKLIQKSVRRIFIPFKYKASNDVH
jgi:hypothetical protein